MQFSKLATILLVSLMSSSAIAAPAAENDAPTAEADMAPNDNDLMKRGFGCPFDAEQCNRHCISIGRNHGYCGNFLRRTCICGKE